MNAVLLKQSFKALNVTLQRIELTDVLALAFQYKWPACEASYLRLAAEIKSPLVTVDEKRAEVAPTLQALTTTGTRCASAHISS